MHFTKYLILFLLALVAGGSLLPAQGTSYMDSLAVRRTLVCKVNLDKPRLAKDHQGQVREFNSMYVIRFWGDWRPNSVVSNQLWIGSYQLKNTASAPEGWYGIVFDEQRMAAMQGQRIRQHVPPRMYLDLGVSFQIEDVPTIPYKELGIWLQQ